MKGLSPRTIIQRFVEHVNQGNIEGVNSLVSPDIVFTDIAGRVYREQEFMENYMREFPNYKIHVDHLFQGGDGVAIVGHTTGSHVPADIEEKEVLVWTAEVTDGLISEWRIYSGEEYAGRS